MCDVLVATVALPVNGLVAADVQVNQGSNLGIVLDLCGSDECSRIKLWGVAPDDTLQYELLTRCDLEGDCLGLYKIVSAWDDLSVEGRKLT